MSVLDWIAMREGVLFTKWGPCFCPIGVQGECAACKNAEAIEAAGLDYFTECENARRATERQEPVK
jgi:hypothetical protein